MLINLLIILLFPMLSLFLILYLIVKWLFYFHLLITIDISLLLKRINSLLFISGLLFFLNLV